MKPNVFFLSWRLSKSRKMGFGQRTKESREWGPVTGESRLGYREGEREITWSLMVTANVENKKSPLRKKKKKKKKKGEASSERSSERGLTEEPDRHSLPPPLCFRRRRAKLAVSEKCKGPKCNIVIGPPLLNSRTWQQIASHWASPFKLTNLAAYSISSCSEIRISPQEHGFHKIFAWRLPFQDNFFYIP